MEETNGEAAPDGRKEVDPMFTRILLAVDGTESGDIAVSFTTALAHNLGAKVRIVHVNELLVGGRGFACETELEAMNIVDTAVGHLRSSGVAADGVHYLANCFTLDDRIAESASEWGADVIVFGSQRRRWLPRLGSRGLRERVAALTGLPTLAAPPPLRIGRRLARRDFKPAHQPTEELIVG
jgi:nucleotide-binding universal stress UspA family protein